MRALFVTFALGLSSCTRAPAPHARAELVFVHQPLWGDPAPFDELLDTFRREHPEVTLRTQLLPNDSDVAHQYFLTSLEGGGADVDVLVADVVWVPEFARAGSIANLSADFPPATLAREFLPGAAEAVTLEGKSWAVPWYLDVGVLYSRSDLVPRAPRTWAELETFARAAMAKDPSLQGYLWQGRQYEGLVCNVYEAIWSAGGTSLQDGRLALDTPAAAQGVGLLRHFVESGLSPPSVTSAAEEESRRPFQDGRAVFMRNWPYAYGEAQKPGSAIRGKVRMSPMPTVSGEPGFGTLGGWQLAVNAHASTERKRAAVDLIRALTSPEANLKLALAYGRNPARRAVYDDPALQAGAPQMVELLPMLERARPRPVTPYYGMLTDVLQGEFSAAITGLRSPEDALRRAQAQADRVMGVTR